MRAPLGDRHREGDVDRERDGGDRDERPVVARDQDRRHQRDLDQRRQDREQREADQRRDAALAALDVARQPAGLSRQVEAQRQRVQVAEHLERDRAHRALRHLGEEVFAQFGEERRRQPQQAVARPAARAARPASPCAGRGCRRSASAAAARRRWRPWPTIRHGERREHAHACTPTDRAAACGSSASRRARGRGVATVGGQRQGASSGGA